MLITRARSFILKVRDIGRIVAEEGCQASTLSLRAPYHHCHTRLSCCYLRSRWMDVDSDGFGVCSLERR